MNGEEALLLLERKELVPPTTLPLRGITSIFGMMLAWWIYRKRSRVFPWHHLALEEMIFLLFLHFISLDNNVVPL
jgi:hypothetical protein